MSKRKREREILHNYIESLVEDYKEFHPDELIPYLCNLYDSLNNKKDHKQSKKLMKEIKSIKKELREIRRFLEPFSKPIEIRGSEVSKAASKSIRDTVEAISETSENCKN